MATSRWQLRSLFRIVLMAGALLFPLSMLRAQAQIASGSMNVRWSSGAADCSKAAEPPLQVHAYNERTFILRESLCSSAEGPFMYVLVGSQKALLIDTGDVAHPGKMPLAETVIRLLATQPKLPLLVTHTHRHLDHRSGDAQFSGRPGVQVIGFDIDSVRRFYGFSDWPNGIAQIELGDRTIDVIPTPGHNETEVSFYDRNSGLFFSGDFFMPGRLLIDDARQDLASAERVAGFLKDRPVSYVLGGHIEKNENGELYSWQAPYHPREHVLQLNKSDLLVLTDALRKFNGFYTHTGSFVLMNPVRILIVSGFSLAILMIALIVACVRYVRRKRRGRSSPAGSESFALRGRG